MPRAGGETLTAAAIASIFGSAAKNRQGGYQLKTRLLSIFLLVTLLITACSSAPKTSTSPSGALDRQAAAGASAPAAQPAAPLNEGSKTATGAGATETGWDRYVIRNAELNLTVSDVAVASGQVSSIASSAGGFVTNSSERRSSGNVIVDVTMQVPADRFESTIEQLKALATTVERAKTTTQDVTEEFIDNEARLANLKASEESTRRLLDKATKMEDIIVVERELSRLRAEIEKIEGRQRYLQRRTDMSTIVVHLQTEASARVAAERDSRNPLESAREAWEASLTTLADLLEGLMVMVIYLWWLIPLLLLVFWWWRRRRRRKAQAPPADPPQA